MTEVHIFVEQLDDGDYEVVTHKDGKPWLRHGPFEDLDFANMVCREMLGRAEIIRRLYPEMSDEEFAQLPEMQAWKRATYEALERFGPEYVIRFMRNLADKLEEQTQRLDEP